MNSQKPLNVFPDYLGEIWQGYKAPDSKVHGASMGPTWVLSAPVGPHVGPMDLAIRGIFDCFIGANDTE